MLTGGTAAAMLTGGNPFYSKYINKSVKRLLDNFSGDGTVMRNVPGAL